MFFSKQSPILGVPVIPNGSWYAGHLHLMRERDFEVCIRSFAVDYADEKGRCTFWMGPTTPALSVTRYKDVQALLKVSSHREIFPIMKGHLEHFFGKYNIASLTGKEWKNKRAVFVKALHGSAFFEHNKSVIRTATLALVDRLETEEYVDDIQALLQMLTLDIFGQAMLHENFGCCENLSLSRVARALQFLSTEVMRRMTADVLNPAAHLYFLPTAANRRYAEENAFLLSYIGKIVQSRRDLLKSNNEAVVPQDLLTALIQNSEGDFMSEEMIFDVLKSLMFAGFDTTSVTMTFVLYLLSRHPEVEQKCIEEIESEPEDHVYLGAVIKETMRLYPPAISTTRSAERDLQVDDIHIPKGMYLYFPIWVIQRDEGHFPDPLVFIPERWARQDSDGVWRLRMFGENDGINIPAGNPEAFLAFSAGARNCAGQRFALQEMTIALSILLKNYAFESRDDYELQLHRPGVVQCPKIPLPMKIKKRKKDSFINSGVE